MSFKFLVGSIFMVLVPGLIIAQPAEIAQNSDLSARVQSADACFARKLAKYAAEHPERPARYSSATAIYVAERLVADIRFNEEAHKLDGAIFRLDPETFCQEILFEPYVASLPAAAAELNKQSAGGLAPLGTDEIESTSVIVEKYQNLFGKHHSGHSDLTVDAIRTYTTYGTEFSKQAEALVRKASQSPDMYRWSDGRYHAHTPEYDPGDAAVREKTILEGQVAFTQLMCRLMAAFTREAEQHDYERSLFLLGVMSHSVQDLTYHHGITLRQHAGLSYVSNRNPDLPSGVEGMELKRRAIANTEWVLKQSQKKVSPTIWAAISQWVPTGGFSYMETAASVFGAEGGSASQDISARALVDYWLLSVPYLLGWRSTNELAATACTERTGLACWDVPAVLKAVEDELAKPTSCF
jgi:hypothetical protein